MFPSDVDPDVLEAELEVFRNIVDRKEELKNGSTNNIVQFPYEQSNALPLIWKAYQLMPTAPISVSKDERTFSHLKFVKNVYRSTMGDKRLDNLMLLNCEKDLTDDLDMYHALNQWACIKTHAGVRQKTGSIYYHYTDGCFQCFYCLNRLYTCCLQKYNGVPNVYNWKGEYSYMVFCIF